MKTPSWLQFVGSGALLALLVGCATPASKDFTEFKTAKPTSILVLPPVNQSPDVNATYGVYSHVQRPLAENGYYVYPITLVDETFKQNGYTVVDDIHHIQADKLREIFGADTALYITVKDYGTKYYVVGSAAIVNLEGKLVDLRSGKTLWEGKATASSEEGQNNNQGGGLAGLLVAAIVKQVLSTTTDQSYRVAGIANQRLLASTMPVGPRHPDYGVAPTNPAPAK